MGYEWKKQDKHLYLPKTEPQRVTIPEFKFFTLKGKGNPNEDAFAEAVGVLYSLSYAVKMMPKKGTTPEGYFEYTVFPLEGVWDLDEEGRELNYLNKDHLIYTLMIRQPDFVTEQLAQEVLASVKKKKHHVLLDQVKFISFEEGECVQLMHLGSYDSEPVDFARMEAYCELEGLKRHSKIHREIYLSDARKTAPDKLKTVLRFNVDKF